MKANPLGSDVLKSRTVALIFQRHSTRTRVTLRDGDRRARRPPDGPQDRGHAARPRRVDQGHRLRPVEERRRDRHPHRPRRARRGSSPSTPRVPVINMLTADHHPCQAFADLLTLKQTFGDLDGLKLAYVGDGNNVARSLAIVGALAGVKVSVAAPDGYQLEAGRRRRAHRGPVRGREGRQRRLHRRLGEHERLARDRRRAHAGARAPTSSTTSCSPPPRRARSRCTASRPIRARRSPRRCSTGSASASGTRRRTAAMPRRLCSNSSAASSPARSPLLRAPHRSARDYPQSSHGPDHRTTTRPRRGDQLTLTVDTLAYGGAGVARHRRLCRLRPGRHSRATPCASRSARPSAPTPRRACSRWSRPSPDRIEPLADHPGAPWQVIPYAKQLEIKHEQVDDALQADRQARRLHARADRPGRAGVALPQQARVLVRQGRGTAG